MKVKLLLIVLPSLKDAAHVAMQGHEWKERGLCQRNLVAGYEPVWNQRDWNGSYQGGLKTFLTTPTEPYRIGMNN